MLTLKTEADLSLAGARVRLRSPGRSQPVLPVLGAAALAAITAVVLAGAVILGPPGLVQSAVAPAPAASGS